MPIFIQVSARIPAEDLARARAWYEDKLGLVPVEERPGGLRYQCGSGSFVIFASHGAASGTHTQLAFEVDDIEVAAAELRARGVKLVSYKLPGLPMVNDIAEISGNYPSKGGVGERACWFYDSEGNLIGVGQAMREH